MSDVSCPASARSVVDAYCAAWIAGDTMTLVSLYHEDLELRWPGSYQLAGVHSGLEASIDALLTLQVATNRVPVRFLDVFESDRAVMVTVVERWTRPSDPHQTMEITRALEFTVADSKIRTCRIYESDQLAIDAWFASVDALAE